MDVIVVIIGREYERFMMELEDLKLCIQESIIKQDNATIKWLWLLSAIQVLLWYAY